MISIPVKDGENIERALNRFKKKFDRTGVIKQLRARKQYIKPSVQNRAKIIKAVYVNKLRQDEQF